MEEVTNACCVIIKSKSVRWKMLEARMSENFLKGLVAVSKQKGRDFIWRLDTGRGGNTEMCRKLRSKEVVNGTHLTWDCDKYLNLVKIKMEVRVT
jgi:hypothetical protein